MATTLLNCPLSVRASAGSGKTSTLVERYINLLRAGFTPKEKGFSTKQILEGTRSGDVEVLYLLGADECDVSQIGGHCFVIYQGHHGDAGAARADVILPGAAYTEKDALYVNTEGRVQQAFAAILPPGEAKEDWKIIRALSEYVHKTLPFNTLAELRGDLAKTHPHFAAIGEISPATWAAFGTAGTVASAPFGVAMPNYYMTDVISRNSVTM
ncbi:MAG: hypothetical protein EBZ49_16275, partial [Proteobacteria bacterium]|nr:hypothetical protein [Pseudomonadota bacterium]